MRPLEWVFAWEGLLPHLHLTALLEGEFFPKWIAVLWQWLCTTPDYGEIMQWYAPSVVCLAF